MVLRLINYLQIPPYKAQNQQDISIMRRYNWYKDCMKLGIYVILSRYKS